MQDPNPLGDPTRGTGKTGNGSRSSPVVDGVVCAGSADGSLYTIALASSDRGLAMAEWGPGCREEAQIGMFRGTVVGPEAQAANENRQPTPRGEKARGDTNPSRHTLAGHPDREAIHSSQRSTSSP
jgi:hypothetical protein